MASIEITVIDEKTTQTILPENIILYLKKVQSNFREKRKNDIVIESESINYGQFEEYSGHLAHICNLGDYDEEVVKKAIENQKGVLDIEKRDYFYSIGYENNDRISQAILQQISEGSLDKEQILKYCIYPDKMMTIGISPEEYFSFLYGIKPIMYIPQKSRLPDLIHLASNLEQNIISHQINLCQIPQEIKDEVLQTWITQTQTMNVFQRFAYNNGEIKPYIGLLRTLSKLERELK